MNELLTKARTMLKQIVEIFNETLQSEMINLEEKAMVEK